MRSNKTKILYITAQMPWGRAESFLVGEACEMKHQGAEIFIVPRNPSREVFHREARALLKNSLWRPLIDIKIAAVFIAAAAKTSFWKALAGIMRGSRNPLIFAKNLAVFPKGVFVGRLAEKRGIGHIHCHWGSTTATMAYVAAAISGVPWSFTLHRWDIKENNMLKTKIGSAGFARCISEHGRQELIAIIGKKNGIKIKVIHMGTDIPARILKPAAGKLFSIAVPANLIEVKGHKYLIEAMAILFRAGLNNIRCVFYGSGNLRQSLADDIKKKGLEDFIKMPGILPHEELIGLYESGKVDCVVLPSIVASAGVHEGVPVALMEAMARGIPVISTDTGAIGELLTGGAGMMAKERSATDLAAAIKKLMLDKKFAGDMAQIARKKIEDDFNIEKNTHALLRLIET